jgi:hypothetical protein
MISGVEDSERALLRIFSEVVTRSANRGAAAGLQVLTKRYAFSRFSLFTGTSALFSGSASVLKRTISKRSFSFRFDRQEEQRLLRLLSFGRPSSRWCPGRSRRLWPALRRRDVRARRREQEEIAVIGRIAIRKQVNADRSVSVV